MASSSSSDSPAQTFCITLRPINSGSGAMSSVDIYVQVTATAHDLSGRASDSPQLVIVEVPAVTIERYREQSLYTNEATDEQLPNILRAKSVRTR